MSMLFHNPRFRVVNSSGVPYNAARLFAYITGTTTPQATYSNNTLGAANTNPVVSDSGGLFGPIYLDQSLSKYKFVCKTSVADGDETLWTVDPYENDNDGAFTGNMAITGDVAITGDTTLTGDLTIVDTAPHIALSESDQGTNLKRWGIDVSGGVLTISTLTDAGAAGKNILVVTRGTTTALASIAIGNATDLPTITVNGISAFLGKYAYKTASTARSGTTTLAADTHLSLSLEAGTYALSMWAPMWCTTANTGGFKMSFEFGGTLTNFVFGVKADAATDRVLSTGTESDVFSIADPIVGTLNASGWVEVSGSITVTAVGTLALHWAQSTSDANATNLGIGGWLKAIKIG